MNGSPHQTRLRLGTMGFGYSDWAGVFYPSGSKAGDYLSWYARHFDTVELDTTFHATPPAERVRRWADFTPDGFRFAVKTLKEITHAGALGRRSGEMKQFLDVMRELGPKFAVVLLQLPPGCGMDQFEELERLLKTLPQDLRFAVEFRNSSWGQQRTLDLLREHRCALVAAEYLTRPGRIHVTSDFLYLRWVGEHQRYAGLNREQADMTPSLEWWKAQVEQATRGGDVRDVFGFFNNDYSGYAVATCRRFMRMMGLAVAEEEVNQDAAGQGRLFG
ncbi:MAG TPA: DUF72 domain-containing protein [Tepidisphaeraceae bacterium]|jgi:uncharacterized protein YecE (DUF72 family)